MKSRRLGEGKAPGQAAVSISEVLTVEHRMLELGAEQGLWDTTRRSEGSPNKHRGAHMCKGFTGEGFSPLRLGQLRAPISLRHIQRLHLTRAPRSALDAELPLKGFKL